jgi:hypothetical protein
MVKPLVKERRAGVRANRVLSIEYRLRGGKAQNADQVWHLSTTQDVGSGGLSFYSDHEYRIEDVLEIRLVMSGVLDVFKGSAKVIRVERKQMAASFLTAVRFAPRTPNKPRIGCVGAAVLKPGNRI